jgi:hypothetical protein
MTAAVRALLLSRDHSVAQWERGLRQCWMALRTLALGDAPPGGATDGRSHRHRASDEGASPPAENGQYGANRRSSRRVEAAHGRRVVQ